LRQLSRPAKKQSVIFQEAHCTRRASTNLYTKSVEESCLLFKTRQAVVIAKLSSGKVMLPFPEHYLVILYLKMKMGAMLLCLLRRCIHTPLWLAMTYSWVQRTQSLYITLHLCLVVKQEADATSYFNRLCAICCPIVIEIYENVLGEGEILTSET
jgi:hypothetical protein